MPACCLCSAHSYWTIVAHEKYRFIPGSGRTNDSQGSGCALSAAKDWPAVAYGPERENPARDIRPVV